MRVRIRTVRIPNVNATASVDLLRSIRIVEQLGLMQTGTHTMRVDNVVVLQDVGY